MTDRTLWALGCQWEHGAYEKTWHELDFGRAGGNGVTLPVDEGLELSLRGRIDRVDFAEEDGSLYVKVIDYKSGSTKLDLGKEMCIRDRILCAKDFSMVTRQKN